MGIEEVYEQLCWYDKRNPNQIHDVDQDVVVPRRDNCACDNCYNGKDRLAMEVLRLQKLLLEMTK